MISTRRIIFPLPEPVITGTATRVMSLRDGTKKMSKSDELRLFAHQPDGRLPTRSRRRSARPARIPIRCPSPKRNSKERPEAENLINIYAALADETREQSIARFAGQQFSAFKNELAELTVAKISPITAEMRRLLGDPAEIDRILKAGAQKASAICAPIVAEVKHMAGLVG